MKTLVVVTMAMLSLAACGKKDEATAQPDPAQAAASAQGASATGPAGQVKATGSSVTITGAAPQGGGAVVVKQDGKTTVDTNGTHVETKGGDTKVVTPGASVDTNKNGDKHVETGGIKVDQDKNGKGTVVVPGVGTIKTN